MEGLSSPLAVADLQGQSRGQQVRLDVVGIPGEDAVHDLHGAGLESAERDASQSQLGRDVVDIDPEGFREQRLGVRNLVGREEQLAPAHPHGVVVR